MSHTVSAEEAKRFNFVNEILPELELEESEWPDMAKIPTIGKLLATDQKTLENCMGLINAARDNNRIDATIWRELKMCVDNSMDPEFISKMQADVSQTLGKNKKKV